MAQLKNCRPQMSKNFKPDCFIIDSENFSTEIGTAHLYVIQKYSIEGNNERETEQF
jgi:hypothetical protein